MSRIVLAVFALALACGALSLAAPASAQDASAGASAASGTQQAECRYALVDGAAVRVVLDDDRTGGWDADGNWYNGDAIYSGASCPTGQPVPTPPQPDTTPPPNPCTDGAGAIDYAAMHPEFCGWGAGSAPPLSPMVPVIVV